MFHDASKEEWRDILGYEGLYMVSSFGRVRSLDRTTTFPCVLTKSGTVTRTRKGNIRPLQKGKNGYCMVQLTALDGTHKGRTVHSLVCEAWHGERPYKAQVSHLNGVRDDNRPENMCWESSKDNNARKDGHGTAQRGERHSMAILNNDSVVAIRILAKQGLERVRIARAFGVSADCVNDILAGRSWAHVTEVEAA